MMHRRQSLWVFCLAAVATAAAAAEKSGTKAASPNLDGVWRGFVVYGRGEQSDRGSVHLELTIKGNHITARRLDGRPSPLGQGDYVYTKGRPRTLDATETGRKKAKSYLGICKFAPDTIIWCVATPGNPRPTNFESKGPQYLMVLKRQKQ
jgi:uncharacterized protein (TIGR03067 family)